MKTTSLALEAYEKVLRDGSDIHAHLPFLRDSAWGNVLEIGVRQGASTSALLVGIEERGGHLWSVDIKDCPCFPDHPLWTFIQADSVKAAKQIKAMIPDSLDVLFIDGDHSHEAVLSDLTNYGDRAKLILLHDADNPEHLGVRAAIEDYCGINERPYYIRHGSFGLGVVIR